MDKFTIFERTIDANLKRLLLRFIRLYNIYGLTPYVSANYYEFILEAYKVDRKYRYSISLLANIFNENKLPTNLLINIYVHSLYCLALYNKKDIYKEFLI